MTVEDVLAGRFVDSSSSSSEASSNYAITQVQQPRLLFQLESMAFQKLVLPPLSSLPQFPISLERIDVSALPRSSTARNNICVDNALDTNPLAIVPFQPSLHAVLISLWASAQSDTAPSLNSDSTLCDMQIDPQDDQTLADMQIDPQESQSPSAVPVLCEDSSTLASVPVLSLPADSS